MPFMVTRPVIDSIASVTRRSWRSVVGARYWLKQVKTMRISSMGGCSSCRELGWIIPILHCVQPSCLTPILAKVLYEHMAFASLDFLAVVKSSFCSTHLSGLHRLTIQTPRGGMFVPFLMFSDA